MDSGREALLSEKRMVCAGLREWPAVLYGPDAAFTSAAVELVIAAFDGSLADPGWPWVRESDMFGVFWLDPDPMPDFDGEGGELRLLPVVEALLGGRRVPDLVAAAVRAGPVDARPGRGGVRRGVPTGSVSWRCTRSAATRRRPRTGSASNAPRRRPWSTTSPDGWRHDRRTSTPPATRSTTAPRSATVEVSPSAVLVPLDQERSSELVEEPTVQRPAVDPGVEARPRVAAAGGAAAGAAGLGEVVAGVPRRRLLVAAPRRAPASRSTRSGCRCTGCGWSAGHRSAWPASSALCGAGSSDPDGRAVRSAMKTPGSDPAVFYRVTEQHRGQVRGRLAGHRRRCGRGRVGRLVGVHRRRPAGPSIAAIVARAARPVRRARPVGGSAGHVPLGRHRDRAPADRGPDLDRARLARASRS